MGCCASQTSADALEVQSTQLPSIGIPKSNRGSVVKTSDDDPLTITGEGSAMASAPIEQDAAYWEVRTYLVCDEFLVDTAVYHTKHSILINHHYHKDIECHQF